MNNPKFGCFIDRPHGRDYSPMQALEHLSRVTGVFTDIKQQDGKLQRMFYEARHATVIKWIGINEQTADAFAPAVLLHSQVTITHCIGPLEKPITVRTNDVRFDSSSLKITEE